MLIPLQYLQKDVSLGCPIMKDQEVPDPLEFKCRLCIIPVDQHGAKVAVRQQVD